MLTWSSIYLLSKKELEDLTTIRKLYEQQMEMYKNKTHPVKADSLRIFYPQVRPIIEQNRLPAEASLLTIFL